MKKHCLLAAALAVLALPASASAQTVTQTLKGLFDVTKTNIMASAEMLDEELYSYRPTEEVRSMGELFGHIANAQYAFCSAAAGESSPATENFEQTRTSKAALIEALEMGFGYCERVYAGISDADGARSVTFFGAPNTTHGVLAFNSAHNYEHYGNLVTYMRLNGIVPPSSAQSSRRPRFDRGRGQHRAGGVVTMRGHALASFRAKGRRSPPPSSRSRAPTARSAKCRGGSRSHRPIVHA